MSQRHYTTGGNFSDVNVNERKKVDEQATKITSLSEGVRGRSQCEIGMGIFDVLRQLCAI